MKKVLFLLTITSIQYATESIQPSNCLVSLYLLLPPHSLWAVGSPLPPPPSSSSSRGQNTVKCSTLHKYHISLYILVHDFKPFQNVVFAWISFVWLCERHRSFISKKMTFYGLIKSLLYTHIFLVIFILFSLLICHDDTDPQGVKDWVIPVWVVWSRTVSQWYR